MEKENHAVAQINGVEGQSKVNGGLLKRKREEKKEEEAVGVEGVKSTQKRPMALSPQKKKHHPSPESPIKSPAREGGAGLKGGVGVMGKPPPPKPIMPTAKKGILVPTGSLPTLYAASMNKPGTTVKGIHVDLQRRYLVEQRVSKISTKGQTVVSYKIKSEVTGELKKLTLKGPWAELDWLASGSLINIVMVEADEHNCFTVERNQGYLIVEPDKLVSATSIISQLFCERKSALVSRFFMGAGDNLNMFRGVLAHELICRAMANQTLTNEQLVKSAIRICERQDMLERAYGIGLTDADLERIQKDVAKWVERYMNQRFSKTANLDPKYQSFKFIDLLGVEDNIWNPTFGLKGKIDATVRIQKNSTDKPITVPLEFKTGSTKPQSRQVLKADHIGQVALYTLMMSIKFGTIDDAILYYISDDSLTLHPSKTVELQQLILMRNRYIRYTTLSDGELPHLPRPHGVDYNFQCKNCEAKNMCTLQLRKKKYPDEQLTKTEKLLLESTPLSDEEFHFMDEWLQIINAETEEVEKKFNEKWLWTKTPAEREAAGICVTDLKICGETQAFKNSAGKTGYLVSLIKRSSETQNSQDNIPLPFHVDDFVVFSSNVEVCINYGVVVMIRANEMTLMLEQELHREYIDADFIYCVDKVNSSSPIASQYGYLVKLMDNTEDASRLRDYIIKKKQPKFEKLQVPEPPIQQIMTDMNAEQKRVITKSLATDSFLFVRGCPGSGKTTTIVNLIRALVESGKTVLVASYTGTALENILLKYKKFSTNFIKIGTNSKVVPELIDHTTKSLCKMMKRIDKLTEAYNAPVVGTTLLSLKHPIFQVRRFDYCIVDEASQALPTAVLGVLSLSRKYIVFGDPNQLPPVLQSSLVKSRNISDNFFSLIATPVSTVKLNIQYRMNRGITNLANQLMYDNQMKCASKDQENAYVKLKADDIRTFLLTVSSIPTRQIMCHIVSKQLHKAVIFVDTSDVMELENRKDDTVSNKLEKDITMACARLFVSSKMDPKKIGIISPFRGQVNSLRHGLKKLEEEYHNIEVNTVDQYQGREMEVVICSFTKSFSKNPNANNEPAQPFVPFREGILEDIRRLNVAITRARRKLVLIGCRSTLERYTPFKKLFEFMQPEQITKVTPEQVLGFKQVALEGLKKPSRALGEP